MADENAGTSGAASGGTAGGGAAGARWPEAAGGKVESAPTPESVVKGAGEKAAATQSPRDLANYLRLRRRKK